MPDTQGKTYRNHIECLQSWYAEQCDGEWEHQFGIKIDTLDNPGWMLEVDIWETSLSGMMNGRYNVRRSESDWVDVNISDSKFRATGGVNNLAEIIDHFVSFTKGNKISLTN